MRKTLSRFRQAFPDPRKRFAAAKIYKLCLKPEERRVVIGMGGGSAEGGRTEGKSGVVSAGILEISTKANSRAFTVISSPPPHVKIASSRRGKGRERRGRLYRLAFRRSANPN